MYAIQLSKIVSNHGNDPVEVISWWCDGRFGAMKFRRLYSSQGDAQRQLDESRRWAFQHNHPRYSPRVSVINCTKEYHEQIQDGIQSCP
jgi:hypothetical protein